MNIAQVNGYHLGYDLDRYHGNSHGRIRRREVFVVELRDADGRSGWGETAFCSAAASAHVRSVLAPLVLGSSRQQRKPLWREMLASRGYDRRGVSMMGISAIDMALHDLAARQAGLSIADLLGGAVRRRFPVYASGPYLGSPDSPYATVPSEIAALLDRGFRAVKPRIGAGVAEDIRMLSALREQVGSDIDLMADANGRYTTSAAQVLLGELAPLRLSFVEEPVDPSNIEGIARLAGSGLVPIAAGESTADLPAFSELLSTAPIAVLQPDLGVCGGFTGFAEAAALADAHHVPVMPHIWGGAIGFFASMQAAAQLPSAISAGSSGFPLIEMDVAENPLLHLFGPVEPATDGAIELPAGPGIGVDVDPETFAPYLVEKWTLGK